MAPLKVEHAHLDAAGLDAYPWLRGHGSIEGTALASGANWTALYPWLRGHGSIEGVGSTT